MYTLYFNKNDKEIKVSKAKKGLQNLNYTNEVTMYNSCYYICSLRKPLLEKGRKIKQEWINELENELHMMKEIKI